MSKTRVWGAGFAVVAVLMLVASWFLLISPQRSEASELRDQTAAQQQQNDQIRLQTQQLKAQFASLPARQAQLAEIKQEMPENPALPSLIRDLSKYAGQADVTLQSVAPTTPAPLAGQAAGTTTTTSTASPIQQISTTITATGSYAELTLYLQKLQSQMRRAVLVDNLTLAPYSGDGASKGDLQLTLQSRVFVLDTSATASAAKAATTTSGTTGSAS